MGNPALTAGAELTGFPSVVIDDDVVQNVAAYYGVTSGDTWASIAASLYGSADVADELQAVLGSPSLTPGTRLVGLPSTLTDTYYITTYGEPYYLVGASDSWASIASELYGSADVADELSQAMRQTLSNGLRLTDLPDLLTDNDREAFYRFVAGDTWSSVAQTLYGTTAVADQLRDALSYLVSTGVDEDGGSSNGQVPPIGVSVVESRLPSELTEERETSTVVSPYYTVRSGDTWASIAQRLYGTEEGADELQAAMGNVSLNEGVELTGWPSSLIDDDVRVTVPPYYIVAADDTWDSLAQKLYGSSDVADELRAALGNPALAGGVELTGLPPQLTNTYDVVIDVPPYYEVRGGDSWASIAQALYGTSAGADELRDALDNISLTEGLHLTGLPQTLVDDDVVINVPPYYIVQTGDTWESLATTLYGHGDVSDVLRHALNQPELVAGLRLDNLPDQLTRTYTVSEVAVEHYRVTRRNVGKYRHVTVWISGCC